MTPRLPAHRVTTAHLSAAYPFQADRGLTSRGVFIGHDVLAGRGFSYDPWALYPDTITGHNMAIFGILGARKSSLSKTYCARQVIFGRQAWILDPKREYERLCQAVGGVYVSLEPGGPVCLNPLEALIRDRRPEAIHRARMDLMLPLVEAALGRPLRPVEQASNELATMRELLGLTDKEVAAVGRLRPGTALWKVGQRSFLVEHQVSRAERWIVDTEPPTEGG